MRLADPAFQVERRDDRSPMRLAFLHAIQPTV
jgi:hypothetical protein